MGDFVGDVAVDGGESLGAVEGEEDFVGVGSDGCFQCVVSLGGAVRYAYAELAVADGRLDLFLNGLDVGSEGGLLEEGWHGYGAGAVVVAWEGYQFCGVEGA